MVSWEYRFMEFNESAIVGDVEVLYRNDDGTLNLLFNTYEK
jgi:hypothetical protein